MSERGKVEGIVLIPEPVESKLNERELVSYKKHRERFIRWLATQGKEPEALEGYAEDTYSTYATIVSKFHRDIWEANGGFTLELSQEQAENYLRDMVLSNDYSDSHLHNTKLALKAYFRFKQNEWNPDIVIPSTSRASQPRDYVSEQERKALREAVLEYGSVPAYAALRPEKRTEWKRELARRFGKPTSEIGREDWKKANGYKYITILYTSLDAGLRPVEVGRAKTYWIDRENEVLRIPAKDSSKNEDNWTVSLRSDTIEYLNLWLEERKLYDKYENTEHLWLTRHENPYRGKSLKVLLDNLRGIAGIERELTWYTLRHSTGTYMAREEGLAAAQAQLRHQREETTMKYDNVPPKRRKDALEKIG